MRIGIFTDTYEPQINGVVTSINILKKELIAKGHEVYIFAPKVPNFYDSSPNVFRFPSIPFIFLKEHRISFAFPFLVKNFEKLKIDIIHSHTPFFLGKLAIKLSQKFKIPHIHTYHTFFEKYGHYILMPEFVNYFITKFLSRRFCNQAHLVITPSSDMVKILKSYQFKTEIIEIPTGIDLEDFPQKADQNLAKSFGLKEDRTYLVYAGRLAKEKNLDFLIRIFKKIASDFPETDFLIIGNGPQKEHLVNFASKIGLKERIIFTGYLPREKVLRLFKISRIFVFASLTETQGLVVLEAMASGLPVVAIKAMGLGEIMGEEKGGFLVENSEKSFYDKLNLLLKDEKIYQEKSREAKVIAERFSGSFMVDKIIEVYRKFLK